MIPEFIAEYKHYLKDLFWTRNTALLCGKFDRTFRWGKIYLKRDLNHLGSHKLNNVLGQPPWPNAWAKRVIAETGAGQHGVATAAAAAKFGMACDVYMGQKTWNANAWNVFRMEMMGGNRSCG